MVALDNVALLIAYIESLSDFQIVKPPIPYHHMGATITDAILQAGLTWDTVVKPRIERIRDTHPEANTTTGFFRLLQRVSPKKLLDWSDEEKPNRVWAITTFLVDAGIKSEKDLKSWLENEANVQRLKRLRGIGNKTADYFKMLSGIQTSAPDRHLVKFIKNAGIDIDINGYQEGRELINATAAQMEIPQSTLDYSIWKFMSTKKGKKICSGRAKQEVMTMEDLESFVQKISKSVGCHYHFNSPSGVYSLKKNVSKLPGGKNIFGWVLELKKKGEFRVDTYKYLGDKAGVSVLADGAKDGMHYVSKKDDSEGKGTGIFFFIAPGDKGENYQKCIKALKAILELI